jgi:hypothetical protein
MYRFKTMETLFKRGRKPIVRLNLVHKNSVSAHLRAIKKVQKCCTGWLLLISNIRMPRDTAVLCRKIFIIFPGVIIPVNEMDLRVPFWCPTSGVDMVSPKIASKIESFLNRQVCKILISKCNDFTLSNEEGKLVLSGGSELAQLNTCDFGSDSRRELLNLRPFQKKIFEGWVGVFAMIDVCEWLERGVLLAIIPDRQIMWILFIGFQFSSFPLK